MEDRLTAPSPVRSLRGASWVQRWNDARSGMRDALRRHWPEYLMEAAGLGLFMLSAVVVATVMEHPSSPVRAAIDNPLYRRIPMGLAMGITAIGIIYSPWGKRSGAHINPAVTLTFYRLGKMARWDAILYVLAQCAGGLVGVGLPALFIGNYMAHPSVNYVVTVPGDSGVVVAFMAELAIAFILMVVLLIAMNHDRLAPLTGFFAGLLVAAYVVVEAPFSGFGMNPARTFASALPAWRWTGFWLYMIAPPVGMLLAAELYVRIKGIGAVICAKLHHSHTTRCIFRCGYVARS